jgi:hypothetical protein
MDSLNLYNDLFDPTANNSVFSLFFWRYVAVYVVP